MLFLPYEIDLSISHGIGNYGVVDPIQSAGVPFYEKRNPIRPKVTVR